MKRSQKIQERHSYQEYMASKDELVHSRYVMAGLVVVVVSTASESEFDSNPVASVGLALTCVRRPSPWVLLYHSTAPHHGE